MGCSKKGQILARIVGKKSLGYCVEYYDDPAKYEKGTLDENYYCEIWIPVKKK